MTSQIHSIPLVSTAAMHLSTTVGAFCSWSLNCAERSTPNVRAAKVKVQVQNSSSHIFYPHLPPPSPSLPLPVPFSSPLLPSLNSLSETSPFPRPDQQSQVAIPSVIHIRCTFIPHAAREKKSILTTEHITQATNHVSQLKDRPSSIIQSDPHFSQYYMGLISYAGVTRRCLPSLPPPLMVHVATYKPCTVTVISNKHD